MNHAIVDQKGDVVNIVWWLGAEWLPPRNHLVIRTDVAGIGDKYDHEKGEIKKPDGRVYHRDLQHDKYMKGEGMLRRDAPHTPS